MPSRLGLVLDMTARNLERVIYYEDYMVINPGSTPLKLHQLLSEHEYREARETYGPDAFRGQNGRRSRARSAGQRGFAEAGGSSLRWP
jgi:DNA-directed RNA polymerase subunit beta'